MVITIDVETGVNNVLFLALSQVSISVSGVFVQLFFGNQPPNIAALQTIAHATIQMMEENLPVLIFVQLEEMHLILTMSLMFSTLHICYNVSTYVIAKSLLT